MGRKKNNKSGDAKDDQGESKQSTSNSNPASSNSQQAVGGREQPQHGDSQQNRQRNMQQNSPSGQYSQQHEGQQGARGAQRSQQQKPQDGEAQKKREHSMQHGARGAQRPEQQNPKHCEAPQSMQQGARGVQRSQQQRRQQEEHQPTQQRNFSNTRQTGWSQEKGQSEARQQHEGQQGVWGAQRSQQQKPQDGEAQQKREHSMQHGARGAQRPEQQNPKHFEAPQSMQQGARGVQRSQQQRPQQEEHQPTQQRNFSNTRQTGWSQEKGQSEARQQVSAGQQRGAYQGKGQQQYGGKTHQKPQGSFNQDQQVRAHNQQQQNISNENPLPVKAMSCNGIVRGTLGNPGTVEVNYLRLNLDKMPDKAYHYDVTITPDRPKKFLRPVFEQFRTQVYPNAVLAFDGNKSAYSMERLKAPVECTVEVSDSGDRKKEFCISFKETDDCVVELNTLRNYQTERVFDKPMRALQVLEVVLASSNHERGVRVGRSFFRRPLDAFNLEDGYEAWTGLYQAAVLGEMPLLNVDIAHKSFPCESTLIQYLDNIRADKNGDLRNNNYVFRDITHFFNGINIVYTPPPSFGAPPKQYKVMGIGEPASKKKFRTEDGKETTVENYFRSRGYNLRYPHLNCITAGSTVKQISLPMELCSIPAGQALNKKDQSRQVEKMIRYAATSTNMRKKKIMDLLTYFNHNVNSVIRSFGLSIGSSFLKVPMRLLPPPSLEYLQGRTVGTFKGAWRMDDNQFLICAKPPNGHRWAILYEESRGGRGITYHDLEEFKTLVIRTSQGLNMNLQSTAEIAPYRVQQLQGMLKDFARNNFDLVFVVLSERGTSYAKIKQIAELEVGILTQCIKDKTVFRTKKDRTVFSNILLKVNGKLNGTNHKIAQDRNSNLLLPVKNVMYLGADVTHPSPDQRHIPSVVGVAASHDLYGACYNCQYRLQRSTVENIEDMESITTRHLEVYHQYQKRYPDQILYYRDGVSDGQFPIVEREEIRAIKRACAKKRCNPKLTCIIVVKRHHTRFFPLTQPQHDRDFNNVQAGTVVDQHITHPNEVQFFMVSHQSIQGTARPTRYNVIMDESKFDINLLQKLTYNLCHLFPRCNRAVSYPAPAYLAHLVAFRGRVYLEGTQRFDKNLKNEYDKRQIKPEFMNKNPMYFI